MEWYRYKDLMFLGGCICGLLITLFISLVVFPDAKEGLPDTKEVKWVSHYMKVHNTEPCIFNQWEGKPDDIVMCFNDAQSAIWAFKSLKKDKNVVEGILNGTK